MEKVAADLDVLRAVEILSVSLKDKHRWSRKEQGYINHAIAYAMKAIGECENIEIGTVDAADTWSELAER